LRPTRKNLKFFDYIAKSPYGQQASVFCTDSRKLTLLIDSLVNAVCRVNVNCQCQRGPDKFPFTGRKDSAYGTLSVFDALRVFSIRTFVATINVPENTKLLTEIVHSGSSKFLRLDHIF